MSYTISNGSVIAQMADNPLFGCILLSRTNKFLSKAIRSEMKRYGKKHGYPHTDDDVPASHLDILLWEPMKGWVVYGAVAGGFLPRFLDHAHPKLEDTFAYVTRPQTTAEEKLRIAEATFDYVYNGRHRYQYKNFLQWIFYIETGRWPGNKDQDKTLYCLEAGPRIYRKAGIDIFDDSPEITSSYEITHNKFLERLPHDVYLELLGKTPDIGLFGGKMSLSGMSVLQQMVKGIKS